MTVIDADALDEENAAGHVHGICLKTGPPRRLGVELEWLVRDTHDPALPVTAGRIAAAVSAFDAVRDDPLEGKHNGENHDGPELPTSSRPGVLPSGALLTTEPGGQLELSSQPADSLGALVRETTADLVALREELATSGLELAGIGLDPLAPPRRFRSAWTRATIPTVPLATGGAGNCCTRSGRCSWAPSRTRRSATAGPPGGFPPGSRSGRGWTLAGPGRQS
jgi:glutamate--cysteine ligase